jgi:RNA polymerase sigma factor (sigma-70 family)
VPVSDTSALLPTTPTRLAPVELPSESPCHAATVEAHTFAETPRLTAALRQGDAAAFRFLHAQWNQRILRYCFALSAGDDAFATEIAQATYLRIFKKVSRLPDEAALWNWTTCAMRSAAIDLRRVGGRYRRALARFADWLRFGSGAKPDPAHETRLFAALDDALAALEAEERHLIDCRYFHREPLEVIAARCGTSARAIEGRLARVRARLRSLMTATLRKETL